METKQEETGSVAAIEITKKVVAPPARWQPLEFTTERLELMKKAICPPTATEGEFRFFVEWCRQTGLNPFLKQAYLVERYDSQTNTKKHDPMVAEAGFAARADALEDFGGMRSGVVYAGDEFMIDEVTQEITHRWSIEARSKHGTKVLGAWAHATRAGRVVEITWLTIESRIQRKKDGSATRFWHVDPAGQLRKCARADQYRRAFPNIFAGWYDPAETRDGEEVEVNAPPAPSRAPDAKTDALKARLGVSRVVDAKTVSDAKPSDAKAPNPTPPKGSSATTAPPLDQLRFGPNKGRPISDATTLELEEALNLAHAQLAQATGKEPWVKSVREGVDAIDAEIERRVAADDGESAMTPATEPGSEG